MADIDPLSLDFAFRHPDSFARVLGRGDAGECARIVESLPPERKAAIVARLPAPHIKALLESGRLGPANWLVDAPFNDAVTLLSRIPREKRLALVNSLADRDRKRQLLRHQQYPAHSVGALVGDIPLRLSADSQAADILAELRGFESEDPGPVVIVDAGERYLGVLDRWRLLTRSPPTGPVKDYVIAIRAVRPETPVPTVAMDEQWHTRNWLPVIDHRQRVLGSVSRAKVFRAAGAHSGSALRGSDVLIDLLADLVYMCETVLLKTFSRKDTP